MFSSLIPFDKLRKSCQKLLAAAKEVNIGEEAVSVIDEYIQSNEFGLAFEHLVYELSEKEINISQSFYNEITETAKMMEMNEDSYSLLKKFIGN